MAMTPLARGRFFLPGPTEVHPDVLAAQARPMIGHRGPEMKALMERLQAGLREVFLTAGPVLISTSSATGLMEAAVRSGVRRSVLCLVNGAFSARFAEIAEACGRAHEVMEVPWGAVHDPGEVAGRVAAGGHDAVTFVHSETSTGALQPLEALAAAIRSGSGSDVMVLVDSVTGLGGTPVRTDDWGLDFVLTGSQKALALPPGLAFGAASPRLLDRARTLPDRGFYLDLVRMRDEAEKHQTPTTPALTLLWALEAQLHRIRAEGMNARWIRHRTMASRCEVWVEDLRGRGRPVGILAPEGARSPTVTCLTLPAGTRGPAVVSAMRERGWVIGGGYGKLKEETVRIGHMGEHDLEALDGLLGDLAEVLTA